MDAQGERLYGGKTGLDYLFFLFVGTIYIYALNRAIITSTFIQLRPVNLYFMGLIAAAATVIVMYNAYTRIAALLALVLAGLVFALTLEDFQEQYANLYELFLMVTGNIPFRQALGGTASWLIVGLVSFSVTVLMLHLSSFYALAATGVAIMLVAWIPGFTRDETSFMFFLLAFCLILVRKTSKSVKVSAVAVPLGVAVVLLAQSALPAHSDFYTARQLRRRGDGAFVAVGDFLYELFNPVHFSFQSTGFSGAGGRLGGPVVPNSRSVMTVNAPGRTYLSGATSNFYTGQSWISTLPEGGLYTHGLHPGHFEKLETSLALIRDALHFHTGSHISLHSLGLSAEEARAVSREDFRVLGVSDPEQARDFYLHAYLPQELMTVAVGANRTGTIFRPVNMFGLWFYQGGMDYLHDVQVSPIGDLRTPGFMDRGTAYHMRFLNVRQNLSILEGALAAAGAGAYSSRAEGAGRTAAFGGSHMDEHGSPVLGLVAERPPRPLRSYVHLPEEGFGVEEALALVELFSPNPTQVSYIRSLDSLIGAIDYFSANVLARYAEEVRQHFMQVPDTVPQRVRELTHSIVDGLETELGRAHAIRDFLIDGFPYSMDVPHMPRNADCFVDFFLFEVGEGYCTSFASAMAVMARIAGIPSRYVEGFVVPPASGGNVAVTNRMAHAWVEIYLEGFGWYLIEATPSYAALMGHQQALGLAGFDEEFIDFWDIDMEEWMGLVTGPGGHAAAADGLDGAVEPDAEYAETRTLTVLAVVLGAAVAALAARMAARALVMRRRLKKVRGLPPNEQAERYFKGLVGIMEHVALPMGEGVTPKMFGELVGRRFSFKGDTLFLGDLARIYYRARYSNGEVSADELAQMEGAYREMLAHLRYEESTPKYLYLRLVRQLGAV